MLEKELGYDSEAFQLTMMLTVPQPLCWTTLSEAWYAPPPMIQDWSPATSFLTLMASSQTAQTSVEPEHSEEVLTILKPNEFQSAGPGTVHSFSLILPYNTVLERCALL